MSSAKYFVAIKFKNDSSTYRCIDSFKKRYDPKYNSEQFPHFSMLAPFRMNIARQSELIEVLKDELSCFFYGESQGLSIQFKDIQSNKVSKKQTLFLKPQDDGDLQYCIELVQSVCQDYVPRDYKQNKKQLLKLGQFRSGLELAEAMDDLSMQRMLSSSMNADSVVLMKKVNGSYYIQSELFKFNDKFRRLLQMQTAAL